MKVAFLEGLALTLVLAGPLGAQADALKAPEADAPGPVATEPSRPAGTGSSGQAMEVAPADLSSLDRLLPVGKTALKVKVPTVNEEGRLTSLVTMGSVTRVDADNFDMKKVVLTFFEERDGQDPQATPDATVISLSTARYHAPSRVVTSEERVTIRKPTLFLTGEGLHYESGLGRASIKRNTRAVISDAPRADDAAEASEGGETREENEEDEPKGAEPVETPDPNAPEAENPKRP